MEVGSQTGLIMAMTSILAILDADTRTQVCVNVTQDWLENTFSCRRSKNPVPPPVEFHHILRIISVGQFLIAIRCGSYQEDDSRFLADFLDTLEQNITISVRVEQQQNRAAPDLTKTEKSILQGHIVHKVMMFTNICEKCNIATKHNDGSPAGENTILKVNLKEV